LDEENFGRFLRRGGRSQSAQKRVIRFVSEFETFLQEQRSGKELDQAGPADLQAYVAWVEQTPRTSAKTQLWALGYYYKYTANTEMRARADELRQQRIKRKPFLLGQFRGVNPAYIAKLKEVGISSTDQMLRVGSAPSARQELAEQSGVPVGAILELVKLSDLSRLGGVKSIRARLYFDAGVDTLEKMAEWDPEELRAMLIEFVEQTGFDGIAPLPKEARNAVETAGKLPGIVEY
jgi:hypothetical protein